MLGNIGKSLGDMDKLLKQQKKVSTDMEKGAAKEKGGGNAEKEVQKLLKQLNATIKTQEKLMNEIKKATDKIKG